MGCVDTIRHDRRPRQNALVGRQVKVSFHYDTEHTIDGMIVRYDAEKPGLTLITLRDGFTLSATECQYQVLPVASERP